MPVLLREFRLRPARVPREIGLGFISGLALAGASLVWERLAFTGLTDLSSDYRVTGMFSGTHIGGAAIDAYLAMTLPFAVLALLRSRSLGALAVRAPVLLLAAYAVLVTFSRGLYAAVAATSLLQVAAHAWHAGRATEPLPRARVRGYWVAVPAVPLLYWALGSVFDGAGYRGLAAFASLVACVVAASGKPTVLSARSFAIAMPLAAGCLLLALLAPKWPYLAYGLALATAVWTLSTGPGARAGAAWPVLAVLAACAVAVCAYWGGAAALWPAISVAGATLLVGMANAASRERLWRAGAASAPILALALGGICSTVVVTHSWYAASRLSSAGQDLDGRLEHWRAVAAAGEKSLLGLALGNGLGRMPETFFWRNMTADLPGLFSIESDAGNRFMRLAGARYRAGYGDPLRILQAVRIDAARVTVSVDLRTSTASTQLLVQLCARHLIYNAECASGAVAAKADGAWHTYTLTLDASPLAFERTVVPRPHFLVLMTEAQKTTLDIDNVALGPAGANTLRNPGFDAGMDHWFFSSDRIHLAWHAKNLFLHTFFEQGAAGALALAILCLVALARLLRPVRAGDGAATAAAAALLGFLVVGIFDSLVDVPRIALLFYLGLFACVALSRSRLFPAAAPAGVGDRGQRTRGGRHLQAGP
jgi:hypothetical protein